MTDTRVKDIAIIGAGFFGIEVAIHLSKSYPNSNIIVFESEPSILSRASQNNQARVHRGYHYPRSFQTAYSSNRNYLRFCNEFSDAIVSVKSFYGIAKNSLVDEKHFKTVYSRIGAPIRKVSKEYSELFNFQRLQEVFEVTESVFNVSILRDIQMQQITHLGINLQLNCKVTGVKANRSKITLKVQGIKCDEIDVDQVFNCTYSMLNQFDEARDNNLTFVHELTEVALIAPPESIIDLAITIMDGPFFSTLPFPSEKLHSLTHVTFTPHSLIEDTTLLAIYEKIDKLKMNTNYEWMIASASNFVPIMSEAKYIKSNIEIKSTLKRSRSSDSRPIFVSKRPDLSYYNIFGAKLDNIYDVLDFLDNETVTV